MTNPPLKSGSCAGHARNIRSMSATPILGPSCSHCRTSMLSDDRVHFLIRPTLNAHGDGGHEPSKDRLVRKSPPHLHFRIARVPQQHSPYCVFSRRDGIIISPLPLQRIRVRRTRLGVLADSHEEGSFFSCASPVQPGVCSREPVHRAYRRLPVQCRPNVAFLAKVR